MDGQEILNLITFMAILMFFSYLSREVEVRRIAGEIELYLTLIKAARDKAINFTVRRVKELAAGTGLRVDVNEVEERVQALTESVLITPTSLDPFGIVRKFRFMLRTADASLKDDIKRLLPSIKHSSIEVLASMVEAARELNTLYKYLNHMYMVAKKFKSYWLLVQLDALLPFINEDVRALENAVTALSKGIPIGDSVGAITARFLAGEFSAGESELGLEDTTILEGTWKGRRVFIVKARGPGSNVGSLDLAVRQLVASYGSAIKFVVTVDAMVKYEGEKSGEIIEGYGVAIGGTGVEKYGIEDVLVEYGLKPYAVLIKMSEDEALSPITKELYEACIRAEERVKSILERNTSEGDAVVVIGVGNTVGVK